MLISRRGARNERRGFFTPRGPRSSDPEPSAADVYSMLSKFKMVEPQPDTLEMRFNISEDSSAFRGLAPIHVSRSRDLGKAACWSICASLPIAALILTPLDYPPPPWARSCSQGIRVFVFCPCLPVRVNRRQIKQGQTNPGTASALEP